MENCSAVTASATILSVALESDLKKKLLKENFFCPQNTRSFRVRGRGLRSVRNRKDIVMVISDISRLY